MSHLDVALGTASPEEQIQTALDLLNGTKLRKLNARANAAGYVVALVVTSADDTELVEDDLDLSRYFGTLAERLATVEKFVVDIEESR